jgi:hypothetical protein
MLSMKKKLSAGIFVLFIFCCLTFAQAESTLSDSVGVIKGNMFSYSSSYNWSTSNPNQTVPKVAMELNQTIEIQLAVTSVSGSVISATKTYRYLNGTQQSVTGYVDVSSGDNEEVGAFFFVSSSLGVGDVVYPEGFYGDTINQTLQRTYAGAQREILLDSSSYNFEYDTTVDGTPAKRVLDSQIDYYFDKQTGVCVEQREQTTITNSANSDSETTISLIELKETNLWGNSDSSGGSSEIPIFTVIGVIIGVILVVGVVGAVLYKKAKN